MHSPTAQIAGSQQELLGQAMVAAMAGISDTKAVGRWARAEREPRGESEWRLRDSFQILIARGTHGDGFGVSPTDRRVIRRGPAGSCDYGELSGCLPIQENEILRLRAQND
ncbi:MAG: hypothetical protein KC442_23440, partial [Thermomicrobiales bacterium]|nr:hypothetical protein [Thermomicrobiales bacterium]